ncbi:MAG: hypothetical protein H6617_07880 [Bdellovibrionaceae bacterium]|nr:hypothetical protein [Bdellovibrionales bacterium]MCB9254585.1 hypothetical protein [Pseudobdellovibrionaceae bacterium]
MSETTQSLKKHAEEALERLETFRDELKLKAHLGRKEAEEGWQKTEKFLNNLISKIRHFVDKIGGGLGEAELQVHLGLMEAKDNWDVFEKMFSESLNEFRAEAGGLEGKVDLARVRAHLAKMEAKDFIESQQKRLKETLSSLKAEVNANSSSLLGDIRKSVEAIANSLPK